MAPLPPSNTPRFKFEYTGNGEGHDFQLRSDLSPASAGTLVDSLLTALSANMHQIVIGTVSFAASGSNIFLPVITGIEGNVYGGGTGVFETKPWFIGFAGRSVLGRKWRLDIFSPTNLAGDFRYLPGENPAIDAAVAILQGVGTGDVQAIDGADVNVYAYVNTASNAYWQRHLRP